LIKLSLGLAHPVITKADNSTSDDWVDWGNQCEFRAPFVRTMIDLD
jgi:hypothetical protein